MADRLHGVLFVCTGNICRSPTAEGVFLHMARSRGVLERLRIDSAGTHDYHVGEPPDPRAIEHAARRGYDLTPLRARQVTAADFREFDRILAMDRGHLRQLKAYRAGRFARAPRACSSTIPEAGAASTSRTPITGEAAASRRCWTWWRKPRRGSSRRSSPDSDR